MSFPQILSHLHGNQDAITSINFTDKSDNFIISSLDETVSIYSANENNKQCIKFRYPFPVYSADLSDINIYVAGGRHNKIPVSEATMDDGYQDAFHTDQNDVYSVKFDNSLEKVVIGDSQSVKLYQLGHRKHLLSYEGHSNRVLSALFSPDNKMIASCSEDKTFKIYDTQNGSLIHSFEDDEDGYGTQISWHPDNKSIAIALENGRVKIYDIAQRKMIQYYKIFDCRVNCVDIYPTGDYLLAGDEKGFVRLFDLQAGQDIFTIEGHQGPVTAVKFSKDGKYFVSGSADCHIMVFESCLDSYANE